MTLDTSKASPLHRTFRKSPTARTQGSFLLALQRRSFTPLYPSVSSHPHLGATLFAAGAAERSPPLPAPRTLSSGNLIHGLSAILPHPSRSMLVKGGRAFALAPSAICVRRRYRLPPPFPRPLSRFVFLCFSRHKSLSLSFPLSIPVSPLLQFAARACSREALKCFAEELYRGKRDTLTRLNKAADLSFTFGTRAMTARDS